MNEIQNKVLNTSHSRDGAASDGTSRGHLTVAHDGISRSRPRRLLGSVISLSDNHLLQCPRLLAAYAFCGHLEYRTMHGPHQSQTIKRRRVMASDDLAFDSVVTSPPFGMHRVFCRSTVTVPEGPSCAEVYAPVYSST